MLCLCHAWLLVFTIERECGPYAKKAATVVILLCYVCPPLMYFHEFSKLPPAAAGSGELLQCWCKMWAATIDCVCLSVACHSASLCGAVWTNDNSKAMTTQAQSTQEISLCLWLTGCLSFWLINPSFCPHSLTFLFQNFLFYFCIADTDWGADTDKTGKMKQIRKMEGKKR